MAVTAISFYFFHSCFPIIFYKNNIFYFNSLKVLPFLSSLLVSNSACNFSIHKNLDMSQTGTPCPVNFLQFDPLASLGFSPKLLVVSPQGSMHGIQYEWVIS